VGYGITVPFSGRRAGRAEVVAFQEMSYADGTKRRRTLAGILLILSGAGSILSSREFGLVYAAFGTIMLAMHPTSIDC